MIGLKKGCGVATLIIGLSSIPLFYAPVNIAQPSNQTFQQKVAERAIQEWISFNDPKRPVVKSQNDVTLLEKNPLEYSRCQTINQYWAAVPGTDTKPPRGDTCLLPQRPKPEPAWDTYPWSAAFISYIMKESGAGDQFKYSGRHSTYIINSVKNKNVQNYPFRGYPITEQRPEIGDLICAPRGNNKNLRYSQIVQTGSFQSHCDIVVAKNDNKSIEVIGGNVGDTVAKTIVPLDSKGYIKDKQWRPWFVVIKNTLQTN